MPIYEFVCPGCGQSFEKLMRGGRKAKEASIACPTCGQDSHRKQVTLIGSIGSSASASSVASAASCAPSG